MWSVPRADIRGELHQGPQQELALAPLQAQITSHGLNMELDLQSYLVSCALLYSLAETLQLPPPSFGLIYEGAIGQPR